VPRYDLEGLGERIDQLERQQQHQVQGLAEFVRYWRSDPDRAEQALATWLKAISPQLDLDSHPEAASSSEVDGKVLANVDGRDILPSLVVAADGAGIPVSLLLACAIAESGLNPRAERWGSRTEEAVAAIESGDLGRLGWIIEEAWPDISFGYGQRIVMYHYLGDRSSSVENCLAVRDGVFADPEADLRAMAEHLSACLSAAEGSDLSPVGSDPLLGALVVYNAGRMPASTDTWWQKWSGNVGSYRRALDRARELLQV